MRRTTITITFDHDLTDEDVGDLAGQAEVQIAEATIWRPTFEGYVPDDLETRNVAVEVSTTGCLHDDDEDHDETCVCSDHPEWTLTEGCRECDPDHYDETGSIL